MDRRDALKLLTTVGTTATVACIRRPEKREAAMSTATPAVMPSIFLAHGSPILLTDRPWMSQLNQWASKLPRPKAILMLSAHWLDKPVTLGATTPVPLVYDFYGFPAEFYKTEYASPGAPALAARVRALLGAGQTIDEPTRGLDHGAYVPLVAMYPDADVPVLQASLPSLAPTDLLAMGKRARAAARRGRAHRRQRLPHAQPAPHELRPQRAHASVGGRVRRLDGRRARAEGRRRAHELPTEGARRATSRCRRTSTSCP